MAVSYGRLIKCDHFPWITLLPTEAFQSEKHDLQLKSFKCISEDIVCQPTLKRPDNLEGTL